MSFDPLLLTKQRELLKKRYKTLETNPFTLQMSLRTGFDEDTLQRFYTTYADSLAHTLFYYKYCMVPIIGAFSAVYAEGQFRIFAGDPNGIKIDKMARRFRYTPDLKFKKRLRENFLERGDFYIDPEGFQPEMVL